MLKKIFFLIILFVFSSFNLIACLKSLPTNLDASYIAPQVKLFKLKELEIKQAPEITFDKASPACQDWVDAHKLLCGEEEFQAAQGLLAKVQLYSFQSLKENIISQIKSIFRHPESRNKRFAIIIDPGKSNSWLLAHTLDTLMQEALENNIQIELVRNNESNARVLEKRHLERYMQANTSVHDFLIIDDAIYSGTQFSMWIKDLAHCLENNQDLDRKIKLHYAVGYLTQEGKKHIEKIAHGLYPELGKIISESIDIQIGAFHTLIPSATDLLSAEELKILKLMYPNMGTPKERNIDQRWKKLSLAFFQHKIPSGWSSISELLRFGRIRCMARGKSSYEPSYAEIGSGKERDVPDFPKEGAADAPNVQKGKRSKIDFQFDCVPSINPPYKDKLEYTSYGHIMHEKDCEHLPAGWTSDQCLRYVEDKKDLLLQIQKMRLQNLQIHH